MSARSDYPNLAALACGGNQLLDAFAVGEFINALDEIDRLRACLTLAHNVERQSKDREASK